MNTLRNIDMDAVNDIVADIRSGEHRHWDDDWDISNAELLEGVIENLDARVEQAVREGARQALSSFRDEHGFSLIEDESAASLDRKESRAVTSALALIQNGADREEQVRADERQQWANYFEDADATVGNIPLTYARAANMLRGQKPFGVAEADRG